MQSHSSSDIRGRGIQEALDLAQAAVSKNPENLEYQYSLAGIYYRMGRYEEAEGIFRALLNQDEERFRKAYFDLSHIYVQRQKLADAVEMLAKARPVDAGLSDYELGLIQIRLKEYEKALESLRQAAREKPEIRSRALLQQSVALYYLKRYGESRSLLRELTAIKGAPPKEAPPEVAEGAKKLLPAVEAKARDDKPWHLTAILGLQYDSNLIQNPLDQVLTGTVRGRITDEDDFAFLASVTGRYDLYRYEDWRFGAAYNHYQLIYFDHDSLGLIGSRPSVFAEWNTKDMSAGIEYMFSHFWVGSDSRVDAHSVLPRFAVKTGERWRTELNGGIERRFYYDETPDDRVYVFSITELFLMRDGKAHLRARYLLGEDDLIPDERADFTTHEALAGFQWPIWRDKWFFDVSGSYVWRNYAFDPLISSAVERRDNEQDLNLQVFGYLNDNTILSVIFQHVWNDSNVTDSNGIDPYQYRRAIVSCMLTFMY
ncbi:MAG: tetratricopeptide repeat protein [Acidobacteriota bacterium]